MYHFENNDNNIKNNDFDKDVTMRKSSLASQMVRIYNWMFIGLSISGITSLLTVYTPLRTILLNPISLILALIGELILVWSLSARVLKMQYSTAALSFFAYSVLNGITLSLICLQYTLGSITLAFGITAVFFGFMAIYGMVTKQDLTSLGSFLIIALFGVIIATLINLFLGSNTLDLLLSYVIVAIFLGLTAYDNQKIKSIHSIYAGTDKERNIAIACALILYLDFMNLFINILRILGKRNN